MNTDAGPCYGPDCDHVSHAPGNEALADRVRALSTDERSWVLYWLASDPDPAARVLLGTALDGQAGHAARSGDSDE